jgi:murein DD-endopeptidase MepM/ murein hydrolase activator NlpD
MQQMLQILQKHSSTFHPVVSFDPLKDKLLLLDFTGNNKELFPAILDNTQEFTNYINEKLKSTQAKYGIGGYNEYRELYGRSRVFDSAPFNSSKGGGLNTQTEPRRLHLGIDIWGKPNIAVMSPLDGIVHSFAFNNNFGDYGATLILSHYLDGCSFHSLYGHLSLNSIKNLREGGNVKKGDVIGEFGIPMENGQWPPHLHFQIIKDMGEWKGDYPGVCKFSEREKYLENCPDPDLILKMMRFTDHRKE